MSEQTISIAQLAASLREIEAANEREGRFVGARSTTDPFGGLKLELNGAAAIHLSRILLDLAMSETEGAHQHLDEISFFEAGSIKVTIVRGGGEA